uniref:RING-type domain-containing protein n=1 Tax=Haptolina brevifila TaxID=156173 RepID=A0A6U7DHT2_9EUKA|mmetsp:Transcript_2557/g.5319  ORF Transcript_2557/g.5319 Transcript_2557/m.5319 type:complete len:568 (+) Transcript_2557:857-2560(+)
MHVPQFTTSCEIDQYEMSQYRYVDPHCGQYTAAQYGSPQYASALGMDVPAPWHGMSWDAMQQQPHMQNRARILVPAVLVTPSAFGQMPYPPALYYQSPINQVPMVQASIQYPYANVSHAFNVWPYPYAPSNPYEQHHTQWQCQPSTYIPQPAAPNVYQHQHMPPAVYQYAHETPAVPQETGAPHQAPPRGALPPEDVQLPPTKLPIRKLHCLVQTTADQQTESEPSPMPANLVEALSQAQTDPAQWKAWQQARVAHDEGTASSVDATEMGEEMSEKISPSDATEICDVPSVSTSTLVHISPTGKMDANLQPATHKDRVDQVTFVETSKERSVSPTEEHSTRHSSRAGEETASSRASHSVVEAASEAMPVKEIETEAEPTGAPCAPPPTSSSPTSPRQRCPVCLGPFTAPLHLACSHSLCSDCAVKCSKAGHAKCPVCRYPHLLDPAKLATCRNAWRTKYASWRKGRSTGATGEVGGIVAPKKMATSESDGHSFLAGTIAMLNRAASKSTASQPTASTAVFVPTPVPCWTADSMSLSSKPLPKRKMMNADALSSLEDENGADTIQFAA